MPDFELHNLATALLAGRWSLDAMVRRAQQAQRHPRKRDLRRLVRRVHAQFPAQPLPDVARLAAFLEALREREGFDIGELHRIYWLHDVMTPAAGTPSTWQVPALTSAGQLADWLGLTVAVLDPFADCQRRLRLAASVSLQHYSYRWLLGRRSTRLLEMPKARLRCMQRRILHELLDRMPRLKNPKFEYRNSKQEESTKFETKQKDLRSRLGHFNFEFVSDFGFRYSDFTVAVRDDGWRDLQWPHLPQGAPTSPALANLCAYRLDCRRPA